MLSVVSGEWCLGYGVWCMVYGVWGMVYGVWGMGFGVWSMGRIKGTFTSDAAGVNKKATRLRMAQTINC